MNISISYPASLPWWVQFTLSLLILVGSLWLVIGSCTWAAKDAAQRGKSGCLVGALVFFTWPIGLLLWAIARPDATKAQLQATSRTPKRCTHPGCNAIARQTGKILGSITYKCEEGHEFTERDA